MPVRMRPRSSARAIALAASALLVVVASAPDPAAAERMSLPRQTLSDLRRLVSGRSAVILGAGAAATGLAYAVEDPDAAEGFLHRGALDAFSDVGNVYGNTFVLGPASLGAWALGSALGKPRLAGTGRDALEAIVLSQGIVAAMKVAFDRDRPDGGRYSFPSGHTANAASIVPIVWRSYGAGAGIAASGLALCTALGRLEDRRHYVSDVVAGAAIGFLIGDTIGRGALASDGAALRVEISPNAVALGRRW